MFSNGGVTAQPHDANQVVDQFPFDGLRTKVQRTLTFMPVVLTHSPYFSPYDWCVFIGYSYARHGGGRFLFSYDAPEQKDSLRGGKDCLM